MRQRTWNLLLLYASWKIALKGFSPEVTDINKTTELNLQLQIADHDPWYKFDLKC